MRGLGFVIGLAVSLLIAEVHGQPTAARPPIIDMHMHAMPVDFYGKPPAKMCAPQNFPWVDPKDSTADFVTCIGPTIQAGATDDEVIRRTVAVMTEYNVTGVISAPSRAGVSSVDRLKPWQSAAPDRVIPGVWSNGSVPLESIRRWAKEGRIRVLGELTFHTPATALPTRCPSSTSRSPKSSIFLSACTSDPAHQARRTLERALSRGARAAARARRIAAAPSEDAAVCHARRLAAHRRDAGAAVYHPQVNVDVGIISWQLPRAEFHRYLRRFIDAGFGKRVMFGSDQLLFPEMIRVAIENIESAEFLTAEQKRDIFYNNAARFLRLDRNSRADNEPEADSIHNAVNCARVDSSGVRERRRPVDQ